MVYSIYLIALFDAFCCTTAYTGFCLIWFVWTMFVMWRVNMLQKPHMISTSQFSHWLSFVDMPSPKHNPSMHTPITRNAPYVIIILSDPQLSKTTVNWDHCGGFTTTFLKCKENHWWRLMYVHNVLDTSEKYFLYKTPWVIFLNKEMLKIFTSSASFFLSGYRSQQSNSCQLITVLVQLSHHDQKV